MSNVARAALPGYNALTDTNLDHYSLYADVDNVLIKRAFTGTGSVAVAGGSGFTTTTIAHNLGYIPFFSVSASIAGSYKMLNNQSNLFSVPEAICAADTTNLYITNFQATTLPYGYDIFYDDMSQTGTPSITESAEVFKVARPGYSANSLNPNDYIMHSDLNTFKILKQATVNKSLSGGDNTIAHGLTLTTPYKMYCFVKFPDGKTAQTGFAPIYSYDESKFLTTYMDGTNIHIFSGSAYTVDVTYIIYGTATSGSVLTGTNIIAVAKSGSNVLTETNPENFNFHSLYATLKYYLSNTYSMGSITSGTTQTIAHNLGYVPFFVGFVNDLKAFYSSSAYAIAPNYEGRSSIPSPSRDIAAFVYADSTNLYLKAYYQVNATGTSRTFNWYYKLFKNNLGL